MNRLLKQQFQASMFLSFPALEFKDTQTTVYVFLVLSLKIHNISNIFSTFPSFSSSKVIEIVACLLCLCGNIYHLAASIFSLTWVFNVSTV